MLADQAIRLGEAGIVVAGGMESMSRAPYLLTRAREGYRLGHGELIDAMIHDGLWDVYDQKHMGTCGDACASAFGFSRRGTGRLRRPQLHPRPQGDRRGDLPRRDRARRGRLRGARRRSSPTTKGRRSSTRPSCGHSSRRSGRRTTPAPRSRPATRRASATARRRVLLASDAERERLELDPLARIVGAATHSQEPEWFTTAPVYAIRKLLDSVGWTVDQVDLFEINEAFAVVAMVAARELSIPAEKLNIHGGAVALGHPIGCSGARILVTLLHALKRTGGRRGMASLCIGGGEAVAVAVEAAPAR